MALRNGCRVVLRRNVSTTTPLLRQAADVNQSPSNNKELSNDLTQFVNKPSVDDSIIEDGKLLTQFKTTKTSEATSTGQHYSEPLSERWADVNFSLMRQMFDVTRVNGKNVLMVAFERVTTVLRVYGPGPPPKSLKELIRRTKQAEQENSVSRRRYLEHDVPGVNLRQRQQVSARLKLSRAQQAATEYKRTEEQAWQDLQRPTNVAEVMSLVDDKIREARADGAFDNLPGHGKPINFDDRPQHVDSTTFIMNRIVKNQGGTVAWVERSRAIDEAIEDFRRQLRSAWEDQHRTKGPIWDSCVDQLTGTLDETNRLVRNYNLSVPVIMMQKFGHTMERELSQLYAEYPPNTWSPPDKAQDTNTLSASPPSQSLSTDNPVWKRIWQLLSNPIERPIQNRL